jgi:two-component system, NarL family, response regulator DevR
MRERCSVLASSSATFALSGNTEKGRFRMKVFVIDDSPLVRERLHELLADIPEISWIAQEDQSPDTVGAIQAAKPDVIILDIQLPGGSGIEILEGLRASELPMVKIMLTAFPNPLYRQRCLEAGAHYFLDKTVEFERIVDVLHSLAAQQHANANPADLKISC